MVKAKFLKNILLACMAASFVFSAAACGGGGTDDSGDKPSGGGGGKKKITVSIPAASVVQYAWQAMKVAYEKLPGNENVTVKIETNTDAADYTTKLSTALSGGVNNVSADIVVANEVGQYLTTCFADYMPYLAKPNPYSNNTIWRNTLESAAYATYGADDKLYTLSFDTTQVFIVYSKQAFSEAKINAADIKTWDDLVAACETLSTTVAPNASGKNYIPMSFGGNKDSMGMPLSWLIRIYADQYFRDFTEAAHSADGDYTYDPDIDADWKADGYKLTEGATVEDRIAAINFDNPSSYTSNPLRVYKEYYENSEYNPTGARWQDMMSNLHEIFGNSKYLNDDLSNDYGTALTNMYTSRAGMCIVASDFFTAYAQQKNLNLEQVMKVMGVMNLPPMTDNGDDGIGAPVADYTRTVGGPNGFFGVVNKNKEQTDLAMDFLMYVFSPQGQEVRLNSLNESGSALNGPLLVKDVNIPEELNIIANALKEASGGIDYYGETNYNPYCLLADGLKAYNGMFEAHVDDEIKGVYYNYFNPNAQSGKIDTAAECGRQVFDVMKKWQGSFFEQLGYRADCLSDVTKNPAV